MVGLFTVAAVGCGVGSIAGVSGGGGPAFGSYGWGGGGYWDGAVVGGYFAGGRRVERTGGSSSQADRKARVPKSRSESESFISDFDDSLSVVIQCWAADNR